MENKGFVQSGGVVNAKVFAAGQNAKATEIDTDSGNGVKLQELAEELRKLRAAMAAQRDDSPERDIAIGAVAQAETAASHGDRNAALSFLKQAGTWALQTATTIGTPIAEALLKQSIGL